MATERESRNRLSVSYYTSFPTLPAEGISSLNFVKTHYSLLIHRNDIGAEGIAVFEVP